MRTWNANQHLGRRGCTDGVGLGTQVLSRGVDTSRECVLSPSRVRTLERPLDLATRRFLLALARKLVWLLIMWHSHDDIYPGFLAGIPGAEEGTRAEREDWEEVEWGRVLCSEQK